MAGDWIKMRVGLQTHPKIVRILSATGADKFRVVGGLHAAWSIFDEHSIDGKLNGYTPDALDHVIGWPGFAAALIAVEWLEFDGQALVLPEFSEHNGKSGKRRAEDQKRKRDDRKDPQSVRKVSAKDADAEWTREEKRREDKTNTPGPSPSSAKRKPKVQNDEPEFDAMNELLARGVIRQTAKDWLELRKAKKATVTVTALTQIIAEADKAGMSLERALAYSCRQGWSGFKAGWVKGDEKPAEPPKKQEWE